MDVPQQEAELESLWKGQMEGIINSAWNGNPLEPEHKAQFNNMIRDAVGRKLWGNLMKAKKNSGAVSLPRPAFDSAS
jgi:hypothetical protein